MSDAAAGGGRRGADRRRARAAGRAGQQRRRHPRQPAVQDDRRRLGHRHGRAPARRVPDEPGRARSTWSSRSGAGSSTSRRTSALGNRGQANYSAAKAGLQGFTKTLAIELGPFGVTANAIAPGFIVTDMTAATAARMGVDFEDFQKGAATQIPVRRVGQPEDIAHTCSFLASEGAGFVSGQVIYVAGGPRAGTLTQRYRARRRGELERPGRSRGDGGRLARAGPLLPRRARPGHDGPAGVPARPVRRRAGLGALPGRARRARRCRGRCRPVVDAELRGGRRADQPAGTHRHRPGHGRADDPAPTAPTSSSSASCGRCGPARRSGASCSASPAPAPTSPRWPPGRSATATTGSSTARRCGRPAAHNAPLGDPGRPHRPRRAQAPRHDLLPAAT